MSKWSEKYKITPRRSRKQPVPPYWDRVVAALSQKEIMRIYKVSKRVTKGWAKATRTHFLHPRPRHKISDEYRVLLKKKAHMFTADVWAKLFDCSPGYVRALARKQGNPVKHKPSGVPKGTKQKKGNWGD